MKIVPSTLADVFVVEFDPVTDDRGSFVRVFDEAVFAGAGLCARFAQHGEAHNTARGTVRGLHWQAEPYGEVKVIRCVRGAAYDVLVDVRPESPGFGRWQAFELHADRPFALYAPPGFAHGYQTLADDTAFHYLISVPYVADAARGVAHDSPALAIPWPLTVTAISARDRGLPPFVPTGRR